MALFIKFIHSKTCGTHQTNVRYPNYPKKGRPGPWKQDPECRPRGRFRGYAPSTCERGWHAAKPTLRAFLEWGLDRDAKRCFVVELGGRSDVGDSKVCAERMRFVREVKGWGDVLRKYRSEGAWLGRSSPKWRGIVKKVLADNGLSMKMLGGRIDPNAGAKKRKK